MNFIIRRQWLHLAAFTIFGCMLFYGLFAAAHMADVGTADVGSYAAGAFLFFTDLDVKQYSQPLTVAGKQAVGSEVLVIALNQEKTVGGSTIIYRGLESGTRIRLDVIIHELDPAVTYRRLLSRSEAQEGFRVGSQSFQLLSIRRHYIRLIWLKQSAI